MAKARFYTYVHKRADSGEVFYVGKGTGNRAYVTCQRNPYWNRVAGKHGFTVEITDHFDDERDALARERVMISMYRASGLKLSNLTDGGEGTVGFKHSDEAKEKMRESATGRPLSESARQKISEVHKNRVFSDEHRKRLSEANRARFASSEARIKVSMAQVGKLVSDETRAKISAAKKGVSVNIGRKHTDEARRNMGLSRIGRVVSEETRAKMSASMKATIARKRLLEVVA